MPEPINSFIFCNNLLRQDSELYYYSQISWSLLCRRTFSYPSDSRDSHGTDFANEVSQRDPAQLKF